MAWSVTSTLCLAPFTSSSSSSTQISSFSLLGKSSFCFFSNRSSVSKHKQSFSFPSANNGKATTLPLFLTYPSSKRLITRASEYKFPDPIPEFADSETEKFREHLLKKLSKRDIYGESVQEVVGVCTEMFSSFLHSEYGGPGTLLVNPFIDMADAVNERGLPGGPQAARAAIKWSQDHVDKDWKEWTGSDSSN